MPTLIRTISFKFNYESAFSKVENMPKNLHLKLYAQMELNFKNLFIFSSKIHLLHFILRAVNNILKLRGQFTLKFKKHS
jgi:hypothetical protein